MNTTRPNRPSRNLSLFALILLTLLSAPLLFQSRASATSQPEIQTTAPFKDFSSYVSWIRKNHKAPFNPGMPLNFQRASAVTAIQANAAKLASAQSETAAIHFQYRNVKVNQDRNPWQKTGPASAVDPSNPDNWIVMSNDFRLFYNKLFFHVSTDGGRTWTDDAMAAGADPYLLGIPLTAQSNPGISFDDAGNAHFSALSTNLVEDITNNYLNFDSEVDEADGSNHGAYTAMTATPIDAQSCNGGATFVCNGTLNQPMNSTDAHRGSPNAGANYVYYSYFCNLSPGSCTDGNATIPSFNSAILVSQNAAPGQPYSAPSLVSGSVTSAQYSNMVIDPSGTPHIFFDDFSADPAITMWESTLVGGVWTVSKNPVATFVAPYIDTGFNNPNWGFNAAGAAAPGCGAHGYTAYCAFTATQVAGGAAEATPSVYLVTVNLQTGASRVSRVNNDPFNDMKFHFFAWATATPLGAVYVGWYDSRHDPANVNVEYFVAKSFDGGHTFPLQKAVSDVPFNPCVGSFECGYFGDYTQLASGPDGLVHAVWSDTRDGLSMQLFSQTVPF